MTPPICYENKKFTTGNLNTYLKTNSDLLGEGVGWEKRLNLRHSC